MTSIQLHNHVFHCTFKIYAAPALFITYQHLLLLGISGSCWAFSLLYTPLISQPVSAAALLAHLRSRLGVNPASLSHLTDLGAVSEENHRRLVQGLVRRYHQVGEGVGLVDIMGEVLSGTLLTEEESIGGEDEEGGKKKKYLKLARPEDIKLSRQSRYFREGENPMPIYCVVRNEVPVEEMGVDDKEDVAGKEKDRAEKESAQKKENYFQWFEFTPFEVGSEEFNG
ncbi:hypothetical protein BC937DRAFT_90636 [Endogone sp. FLAS-F59071]|nr:hypothetical protein BC937DRAFT_90636 [Endogone sp. FLAS-F59071]|eukprot:RUS16923.1 hypothetical protein BC937DRAFT_90636 [Endogone sp. FLAS-F59071]